MIRCPTPYAFDSAVLASTLEPRTRTPSPSLASLRTPVPSRINIQRLLAFQ